MAKKKSAEPWDKPAPKKSKHTKLTPASKAKAKSAAKKAGRKYPSLVDNMNAAKKQKAAGKKKATSKTSKSSSKTTTKAKPRTAAKKRTTKTKAAAKPKSSRAKKA